MSLEELLEFVQPTSKSAVAASPDLLFPYESRGGMFFSEEKIVESYSDLCLYLVTRFPWEVDKAALFLLTGERPKITPLELTYHRSRRVFTLTFAPWILEKTLRKAYRKCQKVVQGGDNRRMQARTLAVMRFVTKHTDNEGRRLLSRSQLTDLWNKEHSGEWSSKGRSGLRKAYLRALLQLAGTWY